MYKWLNGYCTELVGNLKKEDRILPVADRKELGERLAEGHTYLVIRDGTVTEIVKAERFGGEVRLERGQGDTEPQAFPRGSCVRWEVTRDAIEETVCAGDFKCQLSEKEDDCCCKEE